LGTGEEKNREQGNRRTIEQRTGEFLRTWESPVETPFMASEVSEFVERNALRHWNFEFTNKKGPEIFGTFFYFEFRIVNSEF
jgi:hypothetical protein